MKSLKITIKKLFEKLNCMNIPLEEIEDISNKKIFIKTPYDDATLILGLMRKKSKCIKLYFDNGITLECAENHILYDDNFNPIFAKNAKKIVSLYDGILTVIKVEELPLQIVYDISVSEPHQYITANGIVHHNTYLTNAFACSQLVKENYQRYVITRNAIGIGKSIGFFPGDVKEKLSVWLSNVLGMCKNFVGSGTVDIWMKGDDPKIILQPTEILRGQSYENSIVLVEEAQQLSIEEIKCITTRIGENSLLVLAGDPAQKDIQTNGLEMFCNLVEKYGIDDIGIVRFTEDDIIRSDIVKKLVVMFSEEGL